MSKRTRGVLVGLAGAVAILAAAGCGGPGPLATLLAGSQTEQDRIGGFASATDVVPESTRFLATYDGEDYWVGQRERSNQLCLLVFDRVGNYLVAHNCGPLPVGMQWGLAEVRLLPDGMGAPEGWTAVTPNLVVRE
jgi:hypothetical protein